MRKCIVSEHPLLVSQWDYEKNGDLSPEQFTVGADVKIWWKCERGHSWQAVLYSRKNCGCPVCARNILTVGINDLQTVNPVLAAEWDFAKNGNVRPDSIAANANRKAWWLCEKGHSWHADISSRNQGRGCPFCANRILLPGFNDLLTAAPELAFEWHYEKNAPLLPEMVIGTSHRGVWWLCSLGHSWQSQIVNRRNGTGCPYCAGKRVIPGETDLKTLRPDIADDWDYSGNGLLLPEHVTAQSSRAVMWRCELGHSYKATISSRFNGKGCPYCAGKRPVLGETDFASVHPELLPEWDYEKNGTLCPEHFTTGSHKKIWWRCKNGHVWQTQIYHRHIGMGCPYCSGLLAVRGVTDFGSVNPTLLSEWDYERNEGTHPETIKAYSNKKYWWICKRGHHWRSTVGARHAGSGCPYCLGKLQMRTRLV